MEIRLLLVVVRDTKFGFVAEVVIDARARFPAVLRIVVRELVVVAVMARRIEPQRGNRKQRLLKICWPALICGCMGICITALIMFSTAAGSSVIR